MAPKTGASQSSLTTDPNSTLQARKTEFVRDTIWTAAIDLFIEHGFEATTIEDIVAAAGTSRRTFFRYFESKRDLMAQPVVSYGASLKEAIEACPASLTPAKLLRRVVLDVAQKTVSDPRMRKVMAIAAKHPAAREAQLSRIAEVQDRVAEVFAKRCRNDLGAAALAALTLSGLSLTYRAWFAQEKKDIEAAAMQIFNEFAAATRG